jgi:flagellar biosynthesis/type III secretory pathway chaperone
MKYYTLLYELLKREKIHLLNLDMDSIIEITKEKDTLLLKLRLLEDERKRLISKFVKDEIAINNILEYKKNSFMSDIFLKLTSLIQDIKKLSGVNRILISRSLDYINNISHFFDKTGINFNVKDSSTFTKEV